MSLQRKPSSGYGSESKIKALFAAAESMLDTADDENRALTTDENKKFDAMLVEIDRHRMAQKMAAEPSRNPNSDPLFPGDNPAAGRDGPFGKPHGKLRAFASAQDAYKSGRWLQAQLLGDPKAARWCKDNGMPLMAASEGINAAGGVLVPSELATSIIALMNEFGIARQECRILGMASDTLTVPRRVGGLTPYFIGENTELTESDATWDNITLTAKKLACLTRMSSEVSEDAVIDLSEWLSQEVARAFAQREDECLLNDDGTVTYGGMEGITVKLIDGNHGAGAVAAAGGHNTLAEIDSDDLTNVMAAVPQYALRGSK